SAYCPQQSWVLNLPTPGGWKAESTLSLVGFEPALINYQHFLTLAFAIWEVNRDPQLLPNITLGFRIYEEDHHASMTEDVSLSLLFSHGKVFPNYKCDTQDNFLSVLGGLNSISSYRMATIFGYFKTSQIDPQYHLQNVAIFHLLLYFQWNWIGMVVQRSESSDHFIQIFNATLAQNDICIQFVKQIVPQISMFNVLPGNLRYVLWTILNSDADVVIVSGDSNSLQSLIVTLHVYEEENQTTSGKVWIVTTQWEFSAIGYHYDWEKLKTLHGALSIMIHTNPVPEFKDYLWALNPHEPHGDVFLPKWWEVVFDCEVLKAGLASPDGQRVCTGEENLDTLPSSVFDGKMSGFSYSIYNAAYSVAHALHTAYTWESQWALERGRKKPHLHLSVKPWQVIIIFRSSLLVHKTDLHSFKIHQLLLMISNASSAEGFSIDPDAIVWANQPFSHCVKRCLAGQARKVEEGRPSCCYGCVSYAAQCIPCPEDQHPNKKHVLCIPKTMNFLSYEDTLGFILVCLALLFGHDPHVGSLHQTSQHTHHQGQQPRSHLHPPGLPHILLPLLLPLHWAAKEPHLSPPTNYFQHHLLRAISSVLAKTLTVVLAFIVTKPGNRARKLLGKQLIVILACPLVQAALCSTTMFYAVLGYMGFLSLVSFIVAFQARKLPDSFNEAKFITFSMLVFCSVWVSFLPTYLSTKGKSMMAVEIFSILASAAGLLSCIFPPKCYIIVLRPDLNRTHLMGNVK
uniref:G-protein coupled receptors family 3 profile domain-containing protein n=1 Tax=Naja naja TaxID=35670 RepID=A0A8C6VL60_NAJNA